MSLIKAFPFLLALALAGCATVPTDSPESRRQLAAQVVDASGALLRREEAVAMVNDHLNASTLPASTRLRLQDIMAKTAALRDKVLTPERLRAIYIDAYATNYTAAELTKLRDLYDSDAGKLLAQKQSQVQQAVAAQIRAATLNIQPEIRRAVHEETERMLLDRRSVAAQPSESVPDTKASPEAQTLEQQLYPDAQARYDRANRLAQEGHNEEALKEYLWCFDDGMRQSPTYAGVRGSFLLGSINTLGQKYPPALQALRDRRDAARLRLMAAPQDISAAVDFAALNRTLSDPGANLDLYDSLPPNQRANLGRSMFEQLLNAKRYKEAAEARPYEQFTRTFEVGYHTLQKGGAGAGIGSRVMLKQAMDEIEALAGAGDLDHARQLIDRVLQLDSGQTVRDALQRRLEAAGHPELMPK